MDKTGGKIDLFMGVICLPILPCKSVPEERCDTVSSTVITLPTAETMLDTTTKGSEEEASENCTLQMDIKPTGSRLSFTSFLQEMNSLQPQQLAAKKIS